MSPRQDVATLRRKKIVQATIRCLARYGYSGLRMKHVAQAAGVSQGILHYYFDSKRAILLAALQEVVDDLDRRLGPALGATRDPRAQLRAAIKTFLGMAAANREFWLVFVEFWGEMMHDRELAQVNASLYRRLRRTLGAFVVRSARAGVFRRLAPEDAGTVIIALVDGISLQRTFDPIALPLTRATRLCEEAVLKYLEG